MNNIEKIDLDSNDWKSSKEFFESIASELEKLDDRDESYNFTWAGKRKSIIESGTPINKILRPDVEASKNFDNTENMLIVGDNLDALKILQESYLGQVKMIYIDPPYNTGHDFVYHDNFTVKKDEYEDNSVDENGDMIVSEDEFIENSKANGRFHSDWLSMMYPRLKLAQSLLSDDGVIFISIDDNEQANLKKICDEIFGEENFCTTLIWQKKTGSSDAKNIATITECILLYLKNSDGTRLNQNENAHDANRYKFTDDFLRERGPFYYDSLDRGTLGYHESLDFPIIAPDGVKVYPNGRSKKENDGWRWKWSGPKVQWGIDNGFIEFRKKANEQWGVYYKIYKEVDNDGKKIQRSSPYKNLILDCMNSQAAIETKSIFDRTDYFSNPKPIKLIKQLIKIGAFSDSLILDFFAGSGTTGHAVMDLNAEDGGHRKYILVQLPEKTNEKSEARKAGYETIDQITAERLRRAGDKVQKERPDAKIDTGFRVFRIDSTNEHDNIRKSLDEYTQESMLEMVDNIKPERTPLDLLFGAIYASALPFDLKLETKQIDSNTVYLYGYFGEGSGLVACFDDAISEEAVKEIAKLKPIAAVFKDSSFADSAAKINLSEHFRILSVDTKVKVI